MAESAEQQARTVQDCARCEVKHESGDHVFDAVEADFESDAKAIANLEIRTMLAVGA